MSKGKDSEIVNFSLVKNSCDINSVKITSDKSAAFFCRNFFGDDIEIFESFFLVMLDVGGYTRGWVKISQGGTVGTVVDKKIVAKYAIDSLAHSIILCHNHPSGNILPSLEDKKLTNSIKEGLKLFSIKVLDHIILTKDSHYSFAEHGLL